MLNHRFQKVFNLNAHIRITALGILLALFCTLASGAAHSASKTILVLGDSLSAEYGLVRGTGWVALLEKRLQTQKINAKVINASISGDTTSGGKARLPKLLADHKPHIVVIELGGNDALRGMALKSSEQNFRDMIAMSETAKAKVILVGMRIPPNYGKDYTERFFNIYGRVAKDTKVALVPFLLEGVAEKPEMFQPDRIHLKAEAHPVMLENVWKVLGGIVK
jgi:acyl-CoA thioesterase I